MTWLALTLLASVVYALRLRKRIQSAARQLAIRDARIADLEEQAISERERWDREVRRLLKVGSEVAR